MAAIRARHWSIYGAAWSALGLTYTAIFLVERSGAVVGAASAAVANVVPAALLGIGVVLATDAVPWPPRAWSRFLTLHLALALAYAALWHLGVGVAFAVRDVLAGRGWSLGLLTGPAVPWLLFQGLVLYAAIAGPAYAMKVAEQLGRQEVRAVQAESRLARTEALRATAELHALRSRLNPHFLFNTLHSLNALVGRDGEAASEAIGRFASLLRYTLDAGGRPGETRAEGRADDVPLRREWNFVRDYLAIERLRLGERLRLSTRVEDDALDVTLPAFTLQPLVENAVRHAVARRAEGGRIALTAAVLDERLWIEVSDDGPGADPDALRDGGVGLDLVRRRLAARYGDDGRFHVRTAPGEGFAVVVDVPADPATVPRLGLP